MNNKKNNNNYILINIKSIIKNLYKVIKVLKMAINNIYNLTGKKN